MKIEILSWSCSGFRCPDMAIDLRVGQRVPRVALIQMPNGTGKTTTLALLKATLTGEAKDWPQAKIRELRRANDARESGHFQVELSVDGRPLKLELDVDFALGKVEYSTTSPEVGGYNRDWLPPSSVRRFLSRRFVDLFIFDGELANRLLDAEQSRAEEAIETLCQLDLLDQIPALAETYWQQATARVGPTTAMGMSRYQSIANRLAARLKELKATRVEQVSKLAGVRSDIAQREARIDARLESDEKARQGLQQLSIDKATVDEEVNATLHNLMTQLRLPQSLSPAFVAALRDVKANLDRVKLPDSTSRQFFTELAVEPICVCGRPISSHERQIILDRAEEFLGEELAGVLNSLKHDIELMSTNEDSLALQKTLAEMRQRRDRSAALETEIAQIRDLSLSSSDEDLTSVQKQLEGLRVREQQIVDVIDVLDAPATSVDSQLISSQNEVDKIYTIAAVDKQLRMARSEIAKISNTLDLKSRIDVLKQLLLDARNIARDRLKRVLIDDCNRRLSSILRGDPVFIDRIDRSLILRGRSSGSVGQNLAIGYTFLAEALHRGSHVFPLIVDSPAGPLDHQVRREVANMVPQLCSQFIAFTISTEREAFLEPLEAAAEGDVKYLTAFRKTDGNAELMKDLPVSFYDNGHSVVVEGRDYFMSFAKEVEEVDEGGR